MVLMRFGAGVSACRWGGGITNVLLLFYIFGKLA